MSNWFKKFVDGFKYDTSFVKDHTLQPKWYKFSKLFIIAGIIAVYWWIFGATKALIFVGVFLMVGLSLHMLYRVKTDRFTRSWLDFKVREENGVKKFEYIGGYYYGMVILGTIIAVILSQLLG